MLGPDTVDILIIQAAAVVITAIICFLVFWLIYLPGEILPYYGPRPAEQYRRIAKKENHHILPLLEDGSLLCQCFDKMTNYQIMGALNCNWV